MLLKVISNKIVKILTNYSNNNLSHIGNKIVKNLTKYFNVISD